MNPVLPIIITLRHNNYNHHQLSPLAAAAQKKKILKSGTWGVIVRLQLDVHLLGILCQVFGHDAAGSKVHLVDAWFHLHATQKTKQSQKSSTKHSQNIHKKHPQNIHQKNPQKTNIYGTALRPALHCNISSILFGGITQAGTFFIHLVPREMVPHNLRFFQCYVKPLVQKDVRCLTDSLSIVWWKINKGVN